MARFASSTRDIPATPVVPRHVAIIMDGNGRWARKRLLPRFAGHRRGVETVRATVRACLERGIEYLTLFAFSSENWRRPEAEVSLLMQLFVRAPRGEVTKLDRHCVRCHDGKDLKRSVLTGEPEGAFSKSYNALVSLVSFSAWGRPEQNLEPTTTPMRFGAVARPLTRLLDQGHGEVRLPPDDEERLVTWMDANALFYGTFDPAEQRQQLAGQTIPGPRE